MAWLRVGQASRMFYRLGDVTTVAAPRLCRHLPSNSDLGVNLRRIKVPDIVSYEHYEKLIFH